jgi:hypothetical protein
MKKIKKFFLLLVLLVFLIIAFHFFLVIYNDFFQSDKHAITTHSSAYIFGNTKDRQLNLITIKVNSSRPITFSVGMRRNENLLQKIQHAENNTLTTTPNSIVDLEISKLVCNRRNFVGNFQAICKMALLSNGSVFILDNNSTNQKITLENIQNNSQCKIIEHESNVDWMPKCDSYGSISLEPTKSVIIKSGFIDRSKIYGVYLRRENSKK